MIAGRFGGVTSFRYYGELADPELSNLRIVSVGAGFRPTSASSVDLVFHDYRQVQAAPFLRNAGLDARPMGLSPELGREADLVLGIRELRSVRIELTVAAFVAGPAFPDDTERALASHLQFDLSF